jgi:hypothetical protein
MTVEIPNQTPASFTFQGYSVRQVGEMDRAFIEHLIEADDYHRDNMTPDYFLKTVKGEDAWALEKDGRVLFYFKTQTAVRMGILFANTLTPAQRHENRFALIDGMNWIMPLLVANGFREILFDTKGPELEVFSKRHLGFTDAGRLLTRPLPPTPSAGVQKSDTEPWEQSPQASTRAG